MTVNNLPVVWLVAVLHRRSGHSRRVHNPLLVATGSRSSSGRQVQARSSCLQAVLGALGRSASGIHLPRQQQPEPPNSSPAWHQNSEGTKQRNQVKVWARFLSPAAVFDWSGSGFPDGKVAHSCCQAFCFSLSLFLQDDLSNNTLLETEASRICHLGNG